jgi:pyrroloquinoline quinone (PQQ) biosynthesis protein C
MSDPEMLASQLREEQMHVRVRGHDLLHRLDVEAFDGRRLGRLIRQYWYPIHHFPTFLASCIVAVDDLALQSRISIILYQELGNGHVKASHEQLYIDAAERAGIADVRRGVPLRETAELISAYRTAAGSLAGAIGALFATEAIDLRLVHALGSALARISGSASEWLMVHMREETEHVAVASEILGAAPAADPQLVADGARQIWSGWIRMLDAICEEMR